MDSMKVDEQGKRTLFVGLICLDIINVCDSFPHEDQDKRAIAQRWQRGGNASNQAYISSQLGPKQIEFLGTCTQDLAGEFALNGLREKKIICNNCAIYSGFSLPTSCAYCSLEAGTRTIIHYRGNLPEVSARDFQKLDLSNYDFVQFESRRNNVANTKAMIDIVNAYNTSEGQNCITVSLELEKKESDFRTLLPYADIVFISKDFAQFLGFSSAEKALRGLRAEVKKEATLICPWGEAGADALGPESEIVHSDAFPPSKIVDTLGAGDTFISGTIKGLHTHHTLEESIILGCKLAGYKCGIEGYDGLGEYWKKISSSSISGAYIEYPSKINNNASK